jgi:hypothetical protein
MTKKPVRLDILPSPDLRRAIDEWRLRHSDPPISRPDAARQLIESALRAAKVPIGEIGKGRAP